MKLKTMICTLALLGALGLPGLAQVVGNPLPPNLDLEGLTQTEARSLGDYLGRAVLIEYFAYW
jgi:hypothetical protein